MSVNQVNKFIGSNHTLVHAASFAMMDLQVVHPLQQPKGNLAKVARILSARSKCALAVISNVTRITNLTKETKQKLKGPLASFK